MNATSLTFVAATCPWLCGLPLKPRAPPPTSLPLPSPSESLATRCQSHAPSTSPAQSSRRFFVHHMAGAMLALPLARVADAAAVKPALEPKVGGSHRVYLDMTIVGKPAGRITLQLFADDAPASVATFEQLAAGRLRNRRGRTAGYRYAQAGRVLRGRSLYLGRLNQTDALNQSPGTPQRLQTTVEAPPNADVGSRRHDRAGLVSVARGGSLEFILTAAPQPLLDDTNVVIGEIVDGMNVLDKLVQVPTNRKTIRDGYRSLGRAIGDSRANVQVSHALCIYPKLAPLLFPFYLFYFILTSDSHIDRCALCLFV